MSKSVDGPTPTINKDDIDTENPLTAGTKCNCNNISSPNSKETSPSYCGTVHKPDAFDQDESCAIDKRLFDFDQKKLRLNKSKLSSLGKVYFKDDDNNKRVEFCLYNDHHLFKLNNSLLIESLKDEDVISDDDVIANSSKFLLSELGTAIELFQKEKTINT